MSKIAIEVSTAVHQFSIARWHSVESHACTIIRIADDGRAKILAYGFGEERADAVAGAVAQVREERRKVAARVRHYSKLAAGVR